MTTDLLIFFIGFLVLMSVVYAIFAEVTLLMVDKEDSPTER